METTSSPDPCRKAASRNDGSPGPPLPVRPRPHRDETADSYLRRLAAANHLRFSYLRQYLATPKGSYGPVDPGRLAALTGREPHAILRAFPELTPAPPRQAKGQRSSARKTTEQNHAARREKYAAIRRDDANGMSERAIERKHHVGRRTIVRALTSAEPPERKRIHREPTALQGMHSHIDEMMETNPAIGTASIWQRLADDHGITVAYPTLRTYVTSRRAAVMQLPVQPPLGGPG
jgi:TniQ